MDKVPFFKRLDILGFKSFPEKTEIHFEPGITAVIGPNGCGKTNIVDAIRWVTGEQSARALRGSHMEDIIFNGSDSHPPLNIAEVSLTLSNDDNILPINFGEITITRRLFRSGEAEFSINKNPCRLKDIRELLMDTGIGTSSYSIMEQGKVDLILSSKPEERRFLFEEASGIMKYKTKKREALHKLEATEQNLLRINDRLVELKKRMNSLKYQAAKARRYEILQNELKELELASISNRYCKLRDEWRTCFKETRAMEGKVSSGETQAGEGEQKLDRLKEDALNLDSQLSQIQDRARLIGEETAGIQSNILLKKERIQNLSYQRKRALEEIGISEKKLESVTERISLLESQKLDIAKETRETEEKLSSGRKSLEEFDIKAQACRKKLTPARAEIVELAAEESRRRNEMADNRAFLKSARARVGRLTSEKGNITNERGHFLKEAEKSRAGRDEKKREAAEIASSLEKKEAQLSALSGQLSTLGENISSLTAGLSSGESRLKLMREMSEHYEGYSKGVRSILAEREKLPGICGVVAELMDVPRAFEAAVEAVLGDALQYIVIEKQQDAISLIKMLKTEKRGRAVFLPIDRVSPHPWKGLPDKHTPAKGVIGVASELVSFEPKYKNIFSYLLGYILYKQKAEAAEAIDNPAVKLLTKEGGLICAGGPLGGGSSVEADAGLLARKGKITELERQVSSLKEQIYRAEEERKEISQKFSQTGSTCEELRRRQEETGSCLAGLDSSHSEVLVSLKRLDEELILAQQELDEVSGEESLLQKEENEIAACLNKAALEKENSQKRMEESESAIKQSESDRQDLSEAMTELKIGLAGLAEKVNAKGLELDVQLEQKKDYLRQIQERKEEGELAGKNSEANVESIQDEEKRLSELFESKSGIEVSRQRAESEKERLRIVIYKAEDELREKRGRLSEIRDTLHKQSLQERELKTEMDILEEHAASDYSTSLEELPAEGWQEITLQDKDAEEKIGQLKKRLEAMGGVNLLAIAEYKQLEEEFNDINSQQEDLVNAKASLEKAITRIDRTTSSLFIETFRKIGSNFQETFRELFGGGKAQLMLLDEANTLESGIEIIAKPPGKKTQSVSLLSGGERALTAIALLFAIYRLKPSPFCVLDEIDAPLDDTNIGRFARLIKEFTKQSQFIIITHSRVTIAISNVMYGITMQEHGVSKIISVKLAEPS